MAFKAKLPYLRAFQHLRVRRAVRCVARGAALKLDRAVFEHERSLLVRVALDAGGVRTDREFGLLLLEAAVRIVAIAARHGPLEHFVVKRFAELRFYLRVAA